MEYLSIAFQFLAHLDVHLASLAQNYGAWVYVILFLIIFAETGLVVTPFLPGDSLLFVAGAVAAVGAMAVNKLVIVLIVAAFLGNYVNFQIGKYLGKRFFIDRESRLLKREYLDKTRAFFERHGGKTLIISRFLPILRTYAPFVTRWASRGRAQCRESAVDGCSARRVRCWRPPFALGAQTNLVESVRRRIQ